MLDQLAKEYDDYMAGLREEPPGFGDLPPVLVAATERIGAGEPWGVFDSFGSSNGPLQVQAYDDPDEWDDLAADPLGDDVDAWMRFMAGVARGEEDYVLTFMALLLANPLEWANILTWQARHQLPASTGGRTFTCPSTDRGVQADSYPPGRPDIVGCGRTFQGEADDEGIVDCPHCGIWFTPSIEAGPRAGGSLAYVMPAWNRDSLVLQLEAGLVPG